MPGATLAKANVGYGWLRLQSEGYQDENAEAGNETTFSRSLFVDDGALLLENVVAGANFVRFFVHADTPRPTVLLTNRKCNPSTFPQVVIHNYLTLSFPNLSKSPHPIHHIHF